MTGVRLSLRVLNTLNNLQFYSRIYQRCGSFTYNNLQCSTCWTQQRYLSKYFPSYSQSANGLFYTISGNLKASPPGTICLYNSVRYKSKKSQKNRGAKEEEEEEDDDDDDEDYKEIDPEDSDYEDEVKGEDPTIPKDYKDIEKDVPSFRFDVIFTAGSDMSRSKVEDSFYDGKLRLNGEKLWKKSRSVKEGDILDLIVAVSHKPETITVFRTILKEVRKEKTSTDKYKVVLRRWKRLTIPKVTDPKSSTDPSASPA